MLAEDVARKLPSSLDARLGGWRFVPHPLLRNPHAQTIASALWRRRIHPALAAAETRMLSVEPDVTLLARTSWIDAAPRPTLLLVHGLEGSDESGYMLGTAGLALARGWHVVRLNIRNCGGTEHLAPTLYHSGMSADIESAVEIVASDPRVASLAVVGFSLGANMTLRMAGELGASPPERLKAVATVSPAADLSAAAAALERPSNIIYQRRFVRSLAARMRRKEELFPGRFDVSRLDGMRTVRDYDERYIAPLFGFRDAEDYYERASCIPFIPRIRVPALMLHAHDDPFIPLTDRVRAAARSNPVVRLVETERGGHVGFVSADPTERHWAEARVVEFLEDVISRSGRPSIDGRSEERARDRERDECEWRVDK